MTPAGADGAIGPTGPTGATGATGATGPTGPVAASAFADTALLNSPDIIIPLGDPIVFNTTNITGGLVSYNAATGEFTVNETGYYLVNWWLAVSGAAASPTINIELQRDGVTVSQSSAPLPVAQMFGTSVVEVAAAGSIFTLINNSGDSLFLADVAGQGGFTLTRIADI